MGLIKKFKQLLGFKQKSKKRSKKEKNVKEIEEEEKVKERLKNLGYM